MANDYFNHDNPLARQTLARAEQVNATFQAVQDGFDKLPNPTDVEQGRVTYVEDTGAANSYVVALTEAPASYIEGLLLTMKAANTNTDTSTINVNGLGVKPILRYNGDPLDPGDIAAGMLVHLGYDGTNFRMTGVHGAEVALAKAWATNTSIVSGGLKGARGYAQDASSSASSAASSAQSAQNHFTSFRGIYYGPMASDPVQDPNGNPPTEGDWYFNTTVGGTRLFDGTSWGSFGAATIEKFKFTATGGETSLSGPDDDGNTLAYTVNFIQLYKNGVRLLEGDDFTADDGSSITNLAALTAGDIISIDAFSKIGLFDTPPLIAENNLSDLTDVSAALDNLGLAGAVDESDLGSAAYEDVSAFLAASALVTTIDTSSPSDSEVASENAIIDWGKVLGWGYNTSEGPAAAGSLGSRSLSSGVYRAGGSTSGTPESAVGTMLKLRGFGGYGSFGEQWDMFALRSANRFYMRTFDGDNDIFRPWLRLLSEDDVGTGPNQVPTNSDLEGNYAGLYTGSSQNETNFPIGHNIAVNEPSGDVSARNASRNVYLDSLNASMYTTIIADAGSQLAGVYRARGRHGGSGSSANYQRAA